ncbi:MAG: hypothetical protein ACREEC_04800 [Thermoplasmata archaeon]
MPRERYSQYRDRAMGLAGTMERSAGVGDLPGAVLAAVHASIAAGDAVTIYFSGVRSRGEDHREIVALVRRVPAKGAETHARQLAAILDRKAIADYGPSLGSESTANHLLQQARRWIAWAREVLPPER